ncbi:TIGR04283 family arsenosugar biosynthesis glycosyltransferase [Radiobacillus deserti]|uniref:4,4'-diaponeurosporenoate glycosyltransferase n=1 Tax=Radiobacillus deserti TaxID=2594883 RepID=A0A516KIX4_9BACI|nr:TIGR04283 family arsenosugar biosynthesis glycosyltransferase [Radiobacillus deserti]QDP41348.1 glycosyltransferase [Radiobacillus deserti]
MLGCLSVIIPVWNEIDHLRPLLETLSKHKQIEIIIADGGSTDGTAELASEYGQVVSSKRGRASQMNKGAEAATGKILWFLHADSKIEDHMAQSICFTMEDSNILGGGFSIQFDDSSFLLKMIAVGSNIRARFFHIYFGDQAFFVRKSVFDEMGGFPKVSLMEDWLISKKMKKRGKLQHLRGPIYASARRFKKNGIIRTFVTMQLIKILFVLGVSTATLERVYQRERL